MNILPDDLRLRLHANWMQLPRTLGEFIDERIEFLRRLRGVHPLFREGLHLLGDNRKTSPALEPDLSNVELFALKRAWNTSAGPSCCDNLNSDGLPTRQSTSRLGFDCAVDNLRRHDKDNVLIEMSGGSTNPEQGGGVGMDLPFAGAPEFSDPAFLQELLRVVVDYWKPERAGISNTALREAVKIRPSYAAAVGWLNYLDDRAVVNVLPADVHHEPFGPGVLFTIRPDPPLQDIEGAVQKALRIRDALLPGEWMANRYWRGKTPRRPPVAA